VRECSMTPVTDAAEWAALFSRVERPHMVQSWAYGEAKQYAGDRQTGRRVDVGGWRIRRLVIEREGEPVAICQLLDKRIAGVRCASRINRGPLFLDADPRDEVVRDVYRALRRHWRHLHGVLVLAPALTAGPENDRLLAGLGFRPRGQAGWLSSRVDLRGDEEQLRASLAPTWRNRLKASERSGLEVRISHSPEDVEWMIERHVENMREKGFSHPAATLVRALYRAAPDDHLLFRALLEGEAVGGMMAYRFGRGAEYYVGWMGPKGRPVNVGNFLYWQVATELQRRGCEWFDLGGQRMGATGQFKRGMRGEEYELLHEWVAF
jgi:hypothetical protein